MQMEQVCPVCEGSNSELHEVVFNAGSECEGKCRNSKKPKGCHLVKLRVSNYGNYAKGGEFGDLYAAIYVKKDIFGQRW